MTRLSSRELAKADAVADCVSRKVLAILAVHGVLPQTKDIQCDNENQNNQEVRSMDRIRNQEDTELSRVREMAKQDLAFLLRSKPRASTSRSAGKRSKAKASP